ncbi:HD-GYP domain-containing protein [Simplicispira lacusdiani]|uniref:HD-GYP domain-containing protein n=1 Tax=Simplicispira lacusdiani TaxID=2213010 RepID=UPI000E735A6F|nr:HD domain-containing phosphohydrolase [Simplicispira lacusdiani]
MDENTDVLIDIGQLRIGMYIQLDLNWMSHPFPVSSFRIASESQIEILRGLGLSQIRYNPSKSDLPPVDSQYPAGLEQEAAAQEALSALADAAEEMPPDATEALSDPKRAALQLKMQLLEQQRRLDACDQRFLAATRQYRKLADSAEGSPAMARVESEALVADCVHELLGNTESVISLLSEGVGERNTLHPVNVMVLCLLMGKSQGLSPETMQDLGMAALLHDMGKLRLSPAISNGPFPGMTPAEEARYRSHVGESVRLGQSMGLSSGVLLAIAQHHEMADGSGFPLKLKGDAICLAGRILSLVNHYERLCNPGRSAQAMTPHEALSVMFAQQKNRFDPVELGIFIRMMGVYPPGSVVQLVNDRYAMVVSVNSSRPLRPRVIVHDSRVPKDEALVLDLETVPELGIRRSLRPSQLPRDALEYLSPRKRICYFFERAVNPAAVEAGL